MEAKVDKIPSRLGFLSASLAVLLAGVPAMRAGAPEASSVVRGLVILVEFPGTPHAVGRETVGERFFVRLDKYVREVSYGRVSISGDLSKRWYRMPRPISSYRISPRNLEVDKSRLRDLVRDALDAADGDYDVSKYSFIALVLGARQQEYGMIGLCAYPGMLGWRSEGQLVTKRGRTVKSGVAIFSHQAHLGTLFHDVAHILGGVRSDGTRAVPCLYDHDLQARPGPLRETFLDATIHMGLWDPMSCHYSEWGTPPPGISSWTKLRLGWLPEAKVAVVGPGETKELVLGPLEDGSARTLAVRIPLTATTFYLIENRQPIGVDAGLPGSGVLVLYADDAVPECRDGKGPVRIVPADPRKPRLEGAAFETGKDAVFTDRERGLKVELLEKAGGSYRIRISRTS